MKCKHCGEEIADDSNYCEYCGSLLDPKNKQAITCDISLVKWLLYGVMFVLCAANLLVGIALDSQISYDAVYFLWWIIPFLSLIICIISLVLTIRKKISAMFTIAMFLLFGANITQMSVGLSCMWEEQYETIGITIYPHGGNSYCLEPSSWDYNHPRYSSNEEAYQAIEQMGFPHKLSSKDYDLRIAPHTIRYTKTGKTQDTVAVVTIIEGGILVLCLIFASVVTHKRQRSK